MYDVVGLFVGDGLGSDFVDGVVDLLFYDLDGGVFDALITKIYAKISLSVAWKKGVNELAFDHE